MDLADLSTLITKNRGIHYSQTIQADSRKLKSLVARYGAEITDYDYEKNLAKVKEATVSDLHLGRKLYHKFQVQIGDTSLTKNLERLQETADVINFECDDAICTNAQACQSKIKRLLKWMQSAIRGRKSARGQQIDRLSEVETAICRHLAHN